MNKKLFFGARDEYSILPEDGGMWYPWNPAFILSDTLKDKLNLLNNESKGEPTFDKPIFNGSVSNREDK